MLSFAFALLLLAAQPDDGPVSTQRVVPPPSDAAVEEVLRKEEEQKKRDAEQRAKDAQAVRARLKWDWEPAPPPPPATEEEKRAAANQAALARAEAARQEANGLRTTADKPKMKCRETTTGLVCGTSEQAMDDQERELKARLDALSKDDQ